MIFNSENTCFLEKFMLQSCKLNMNIYPLLYADFCLTTFLTTTLKNTSKKSSREERLFDHSFDHNRRKNVWNQWSSEFRKPCNIVNKRTKTSRKIKKIVEMPLGAGCRKFESCHSDQAECPYRIWVSCNGHSAFCFPQSS